MPTLLWIFIAPLISALILVFAKPLGKTVKTLSFVLSLIPLILIALNGTRLLGEEVDALWIPGLNVHFHLSVDHLSFFFALLTALIVPLLILGISSQGIAHLHFYYALILLTEGLLIGFFFAKDLALFTFFYEAMLIPVYFMINLWGVSAAPYGDKAPERAGLKFLIYMIAGSTLMIAALLALYAGSGLNTFNMDALAKVAESVPYAPYIFAVFLLAFAVKTPLFPFHGWLPDAYCTASTGGTILLSALLSKAGIYGILRVLVQQFPNLLQAASPALLVLSIAGVFYAGFSAWVQNDYKRLIAYSSLSHVNLILAGLFVWNDVAHTGAILQSLNHAITITGLFLAAYWLEKRVGTTALSPLGGLATYFPKLCWITFLFVLSSIALPATNSFIGELLIFFGLFQEFPWKAAFLVLSVILSVMYMLRFMQMVYFQHPVPEPKSRDIRIKELLYALPIVFLVFWIGIYPKPFLDIAEPASKELKMTTSGEIK